MWPIAELRNAASMFQLTQLIDSIPAHLRLRRTLRGSASTSRPGIRFIDLGDCVIRVRQSGAGPSLAIATDPPVPIEIYDELIGRLQAHFSITVFELPGFGCSLPRWRFQMSMPVACATVTRLLEHLGGPHSLLMPCVTGYIALVIARQRPDLVQRVILSQTPTWRDGQRWLAARDPRHLLRRPFVGQLALAALRRQRINQWYASALADQDQVARYARATLENFDAGGSFALASAFQDFLSDHHGLLQPVATPVLHLSGDQDASHAHSCFADVCALAPNIEHHTFARAGHFPELEASDPAANAIRNFTESHS